MTERVSIDVAIVGAGIIGLSIAKVLKFKFPNYDIALFDKMSYVGDHASGRNSGVLHAGLYYPKNSLKKKLCIEGQRQWVLWADELGIEIKKCGKYIVATLDDTENFLDLFEQAKSNGAEVELVEQKKLEEINKFVQADLAFFSSRTAVVDPSAVLKSLERTVVEKEVMLLLNHEVRNIKKQSDNFLLEVNDLEVESKYVINAAGAGAVAIRELLGLSGLRRELVKGHYLKTFSKFFNSSLLYPLPEKNLKGLGIHTCIDFDGTVKFGPDTVDCSEIDYKFDKEHEQSMKEKVSKAFKIDSNKLHADFVGIRSKLIKGGQSYSDFWIESPLANYVELCGIESPGLTSAPAIANYILKYFN